MYKSVIISGLPRSGKSTLITALCEELSWPRHGIGDLFRAKWARLPERGRPSFELGGRTGPEMSRLGSMTSFWAG